MTEHQPKLLKESTRGPVFEFGPGWGTKTKKWLKKYILASNCTLCRNARYILLAGIIILIFGGPWLKRLIGTPENTTLTGQIKIAEVVQSGDSKIKLARHILADYLAQSPATILSNGQKVFIETILGQKIDSNIFRAGANIEFASDDIKSAIAQSQSLTPCQLQRWERAAKLVKF